MTRERKGWSTNKPEFAGFVDRAVNEAEIGRSEQLAVMALVDADTGYADRVCWYSLATLSALLVMTTLNSSAVINIQRLDRREPAQTRRRRQLVGIPDAAVHGPIHLAMFTSPLCRRGFATWTCIELPQAIISTR